jgi:hypothetical protein
MGAGSPQVRFRTDRQEENMNEINGRGDRI